jgi:hypothetical protein
MKKNIALKGKKAIAFIVEGSFVVAGTTYSGPQAGWTVENEQGIELCENTIGVIIK